VRKINGAIARKAKSEQEADILKENDKCIKNGPKLHTKEYAELLFKNAIQNFTIAILGCIYPHHNNL
jgi:hypothetical protein